MFSEMTTYSINIEEIMKSLIGDVCTQKVAKYKVSITTGADDEIVLELSTRNHKALSAKEVDVMKFKIKIKERCQEDSQLRISLISCQIRFHY